MQTKSKVQILLMQNGISQQEIAQKLQQSKCMVGRVVRGRCLKGAKGRTIAGYIARRLSRKLKEKHTINSLFGDAA